MSNLTMAISAISEEIINKLSNLHSEQTYPRHDGDESDKLMSELKFDIATLRSTRESLERMESGAHI